MTRCRPLAAVCAVLALAGCGGSSTIETSAPPATAAALPASPAPYGPEKLIGSWGVASYRQEKDRARTEAQARAQCKLPYVIAKGPTDGVMMHVADDAALHELTVKGGPNGRVFLGFDAPPGDDQDREILSMSDRIFVARFVNPEINTRYGTYIYVRCGASR